MLGLDDPSGDDLYDLLCSLRSEGCCCWSSLPSLSSSDAGAIFREGSPAFRDELRDSPPSMAFFSFFQCPFARDFVLPSAQSNNTPV